MQYLAENNESNAIADLNPVSVRDLFASESTENSR